MTTPSNALAVRDDTPITSLESLKSIAEILAKSGFFSDARDASKAVAKILAGRELGFGPMASMMSVHIIQGRPAISPMLLAAALKRSGKYDYRIERLDNEGCTLAFFERQDGKWEPLGESRFGKADAFAAGLGTRTGYRTYPRNMYFARAMGNGCRWYCPDVFGGPVYVPEELGATVDDNGSAAALPHVAGPVAPMESVDAVVLKLDQEYPNWQDVAIATRAYFGEDLFSKEALADFAQREPERWVAGCEALLDTDGA